MKKTKIFASILAAVFVLTACLPASETAGNSINASGTISAVDVNVAPELSGTVKEVLVKEGDQVEEGDVLFRLDDELLQAQYHQAETAVDAASAAVESASVQLAAAQLQAEQAKQGARLQSALTPVSQVEQPEEFDQPEWYFEKDEKIEAARVALADAQKTLDARLADLERELSNASNQDFVAAEKRLGAAQMMFLAARQTLDQVELIREDKDYLVTEAEKALDSATAELEASQLDYDRILTSTSAGNVLEARARVTTARMLADNAQAVLDALLTGEDSLTVAAAEKAVEQADAVLAQAQAGLTQAQAALDLLQLQMNRTEVKAPISGTILALNLSKGELVAAGSQVIVLAQLDEVTLTVYIPEDQYGRISLGQKARVTVDSFANRSFDGTVQYIADEAEYTPRNVSTTDARKTTVYAVKINLKNTDGSLKPGMSADVILD